MSVGRYVCVCVPDKTFVHPFLMSDQRGRTSPTNRAMRVLS